VAHATGKPRPAADDAASSPSVSVRLPTGPHARAPDSVTRVQTSARLINFSGEKKLFDFFVPRPRGIIIIILCPGANRTRSQWTAVRSRLSYYNNSANLIFCTARVFEKENLNSISTLSHQVTFLFFSFLWCAVLFTIIISDIKPYWSPGRVSSHHTRIL